MNLERVGENADTGGLRMNVHCQQANPNHDVIGAQPREPHSDILCGL